MNPIIINKNREISTIIKTIDFKYTRKKTIFVFDIHRTTLLEDGQPDNEVKKYILQLVNNNYNVIFLSYDGNDKRIIHNNNLLNKIKQYNNIPRIFIKKRNKHLVIKELYKNIIFDKRLKYKIILIDDNINNINDVKNLLLPNILTYYYTKNNRYNGYNTLSKLSNYFNILKISPTGHFIKK